MVNFGFSLQTDDPADFFARISSFGFYFLSSANVPKLMTNESLKKIVSKVLSLMLCAACFTALGHVV